MQETYQPRLFDELARCRDWIEACLARGAGTHEFDDIAAAVLVGHYRLWAFEDAFALTEVVDTPRKRALNIAYLGGNLETIRNHADHVMQYARDCGCHIVTGQGRRGWGRALGAKETYTSIARDL